MDKLYEEKMNQQTTLNKNVWNKIQQQIKVQDLYHLMYLKPLELKLDQQPGKLPNGLLVYDRQTQYEVKVKSKDLITYNQFKTKRKDKKQLSSRFPTYLAYLQNIRADNLLYQLKTHVQLEMAICICMYNEDRDMLQNTLEGIGQNIIKLFKQGVDSDKIIVVIIQDGIQKMDPSIIPFFQILQEESGIRFSVDSENQLQQTLQKIQRNQQILQNNQVLDDYHQVNMDTFIFTAQQIQKRKQLRFVNVKQEYENIRNLLNDVKNLKKKKNITSFDLTVDIYQFYLKICYGDYIGDQNKGQFLKQLPNNARQIVQTYYNQDNKKSKPFIQAALTKAHTYCLNYMKSKSQIAHTSFFRTSMFFPDNEIQQNFQYKDYLKMNIFFVVKYKNAQKLSSHNWFFNGFCKEFRNSTDKEKKNSPKFTILLDVGLRPDNIALVKMYNVMNNQPKIGGVCGYMGLKIQRNNDLKLYENLDCISRISLNLFNIQRTQQLQYHFAHLIDKGFQSIFKFIHVLPGAFSGYNMKAIWGQNKQNDDSLLIDYFSSINQKLSNKIYKPIQLSPLKVFGRIILPNFLVKLFLLNNSQEKTQTHQDLMYSSNVNLAQDRILCMGIHKNQKQLIYIPDAYSYVDPVKDLPSLMGQRKRWINGSYFAFDKVSDQFNEINGCFHLLGLQINYLALMNVLSYIAPGLFLFTISVAMQAFKADVLVKLFGQYFTQTNPIYDAFVYTINFIYALLIGGLVFYSLNLNNRNQKFIKYVYGLSTFLGIISLIIMIILVVDLIRGLINSSSYLIDNNAFVQNIPTNGPFADIIRYLLLGVLGLYAVPIVSYSLLFKNFRIILEILAGVFSFIFYQPSYLIILSIYALCRMDDLSWGTKGLQANSNAQDNKVETTWNAIKTIHVFKFIFWNTLVAGVMIHFGSNYLLRFYLTFGLMGLIGGTMFIKVFLALIYNIYYKICINSNAPNKAIYDQILIPSLYKNFYSNNLGINELTTQIYNMIYKNIKNLQNQSKIKIDQKNIQVLQLIGTIKKFQAKSKHFNPKNHSQKSRFFINEKTIIQMNENAAKNQLNKEKRNKQSNNKKSPFQNSIYKKKIIIDTKQKSLNKNIKNQIKQQQNQNQDIYTLSSQKFLNNHIEQ